MDATELRHAYAVLGLSPPVSEPRLKQRYKVLVRRWHPDRFQNDPAGQAEAAVRLRNINIAYEAVLASLASKSRHKTRTRRSRRHPSRHRLLSGHFPRGAAGSHYHPSRSMASSIP
jgi:curved DNA-binding protein CbpA